MSRIKNDVEPARGIVSRAILKSSCGSDSQRLESAQYLLSKDRKGIINLLAEKVGLAHFFFWDNDGV